MLQRKIEQTLWGLEKSRHRQHQKRKDDFEEFRQIPRNKSHKSRRLQHRRNGRNTDTVALYGEEWGDGVRLHYLKNPYS